MSAARCLASGAFLLGVFDGHGGAFCSRHASTHLFDYVSAAVLDKHKICDLPVTQRLQWLFASAAATADSESAPDGVFQSPDERHGANLSRFHADVLAERREQQQFCTVRRSLEAAFQAFDDDIGRDALPDGQGQVDRESMLRAASGSCALVSHIRGQHMHIANSGDSAIVVGTSTSAGGLSARQLSRAHTIDNADEVARVKREHPLAELGSVLRGGRLLGELFPLRALGDVRYKWTAELQRVVFAGAAGAVACEHPPADLHTPPYLTALPEVFYHKLTSNDRFLVLASDGLWEWLEPDTVVRLVSDHLRGSPTDPSAPVPSTSSEQQYGNNNNDSNNNNKENIEPSGERKSAQTLPRSGSSGSVRDDNAATHVIRHALGGVSGSTSKQYDRLVDQLSVPPGLARNYRDDISLFVVYFNQKWLEGVERNSQRERI